MVRLAVAGNNDFMFSDLELRRTGTTYTADTLQILTREHPECEWYFILGADSFFQLEQWYHPERIFANAIILAAGRDDVPAEQMRKHKEYLCQKYHARIQLIDMQQIEISSHEIREMIARGHSVVRCFRRRLQLTFTSSDCTWLRCRAGKETRDAATDTRNSKLS